MIFLKLILKLKLKNIQQKNWSTFNLNHFPIGLNLFSTDAHGHFIENIKGSEQEKETMLLSQLDNPESLDGIRQWFCMASRPIP